MGAGISNAISSYLTVNRNSLKADYWRYEYGQSRIGKSLFEDKQSYLDSSPVLNADKIETPLLIWTGGKDEQVKPDQSFSMYLALRRLKKQSSLLVYPDEGHAFVTPEANKDLTQRIQQWFDCFLKGFQTDWIK
ncbi:peptidase S9 prolyl oligopeptidase [Flavobacterium sp. F52]|nr:peptidase S9 prolyl oligopeptidase [Flavobacterium sp. F52]